MIFSFLSLSCQITLMHLILVYPCYFSDFSAMCKQPNRWLKHHFWLNTDLFFPEKEWIKYNKHLRKWIKFFAALNFRHVFEKNGCFGKVLKFKTLKNLMYCLSKNLVSVYNRKSKFNRNKALKNKEHETIFEMCSAGLLITKFARVILKSSKNVSKVLQT